MAPLRKSHFIPISIKIQTNNHTKHQISVVSLANSIQSYTSLAGTRAVYSGTVRSPKKPDGVPASTLRTSSSDLSPVTELSARTFGTWTAITSIIRLYAAYHINDKPVYEMALWTFGVAWAHFISEWLFFGTAKFGKGLIGPLVVSTGTGYWMLSQYGAYVN